MTISSIGSSSAFNLASLQSTASMKKPPDMQDAIAKLKDTDPELAEKMEQIDTRLNELREQGVSHEDAMATIDSEFGKLSDEEMQKVDAAMGKTRPSGPPPPPPSSSSETEETDSSTIDYSALLNYSSANTANTSILNLLSSFDLTA